MLAMPDSSSDSANAITLEAVSAIALVASLAPSVSTCNCSEVFIPYFSNTKSEDISDVFSSIAFKIFSWPS